jgi:homocysteine S-methyltransferase
MNQTPDSPPSSPRDLVLLDGGMGQELLRRAGTRPTSLWSTQVMADHPGLVQAIHEDYFAAGATIATTNSYAIHRDRLAGTPLEGRFPELLTQALEEAEAARAATGGQGRIAGSIGPLVASYRPDAHPAHAEAVPRYVEVATTLARSVDLLLCETVASLAHADAVLAAASATEVPVWLAVTVDDRDGRRLRSGEPLASLPELLRGRAAAVLANCSAPEAMGAALLELQRCELPFGAYANGFTEISPEFLEDGATVEALEARHDLTPEAYSRHARDWVASGASLVGGCCEVGPAHIEALARDLRGEGYHLA